MQKTECFLLHLKEIYPCLRKPSAKTIQEWCNLLSPLSVDDIIANLKLWVKNNPDTPPSPQTFNTHLSPTKKSSHTKKKALPFCPESYLFAQDIKNNRNKHFFSTYCRAVRYILNVRLKTYIPKEEFKQLNYSARYDNAVERGLFADFDDVLEFVHNSGEYYD